MENGESGMGRSAYRGSLNCTDRRLLAGDYFTAGKRAGTKGSLLFISSFPEIHKRGGVDLFLGVYLGVHMHNHVIIIQQLQEFKI